jgi:hypothetical protein
LNWKIWYAGGSVYTDEDGPPESAPGRGVLVIVQQDANHGRRRVSSTDFYVWREGRWDGCDLAGLLDHLIERGFLVEGEVIDTGAVLMFVLENHLALFGRLVSRAEWERVSAQAETDPDFPKRTGQYKDERL